MRWRRQGRSAAAALDDRERAVVGRGMREVSESASSWTTPTPHRSRRSAATTGDDRGTVPIPVLGSMLVAGAGVVGSVLVAGAVVHGRAQAAADMVAIAGAGQILTTTEPCETADDIATRNDARLLSCQVSGARVTVSVAVPLPPPMRVVGHDEARASAAAELQVDPDALLDPKS